MNIQDKSIYVKTYFRIHTESYRRGELGWDNQEDREEFDNEAIKQLNQLGFEIEQSRFSGSAKRGFRGAEGLYFHPDQVSGYIKKESVEEIEENLKKSNIFRLRTIDTYDEVMNYTEEEFKELLNERKLDIEFNILSKFKTKKSNLYKPDSALYSVRTGINSLDGKLKEVEQDFIYNLFLKLVENDKIISFDKSGQKIYRTNLEKGKVRKSNKFDKAYQIKGMQGHFLLHSKKECTFDNSKVEVEYLMYDNKWRQDLCYMDKQLYQDLRIHL